MKYSVLLLVVGTALGVPILPDADDVQCNSLFQYKKQYSFPYTGLAETGIIGTDEVTSVTKVTCQDATIRVPRRCTIVLSLRDCSISPETEKTRALASALERYELMADVTDGLISEVKPHVDESPDSLNLKKGILSSIQMQYRGQVEVELQSRHLSVHGNCSTTTTHVPSVEAHQEDYLVRRDLSSCTQRPSRTPFLWREISYLQNLDLGEALLNSSQVCHYETYDIKGQHMQRAVCKEIHSFWPGSISSDRGIMTTIIQEVGPMTLDKLNSLDVKADRYEKGSTSIVQDIPKTEAFERLTTEEAMDFIKPLVEGSLDEVKVDTSRRFGQWVKALRSLDNATIHEVFEKTYNCKNYSAKCRDLPGKAELAREYLWDGLIQCGTLECFAVVNTAIIKNIVPQPLAHAMLYTMAFRDYPTIDIIAEGARLARVNRTRSVILPISTLIYRYWVNTPEIHGERELPAPIQDFISLMDEIINNDCTITATRGTPEAVEQERQVLLAVKAIGNLGPVAQKYDESQFKKRAHFERELLRCADNKDVGFNVSLSAIQGLRRFDMDLVNSASTALMKTAILDTKRDNEIRIALFLIYMKSNVQAAELRDLYVAIKSEPSKQFRAFSLSFIANILESEDPTVQELRKNLLLAIGEEELPEYPMNIFKYSTNIELSKLITIPYFNKTFGGSIQSNLIYNANAVMPRSLMIKLAANILGKDWEMIETGLEVQGIEVVMESIFGPQGYFPSNVLRSVVRKADEVIMSKIRSAALSYEWLVKALEILAKGIQNIEKTAAKVNQSFQKKFEEDTWWESSESEFEPEGEGEPEPENLLPSEIERHLDEMNEEVNKANRDKIAAAYLRILGNELGYISSEDIKGLIPVVDTQSIVDMFNSVADKLAEGVDINATRSALFLERHLVLPTGIGMPLNCSANGTAVVSIRSRGQLTLNLPTASASARFAPSASLEVVGHMGVHVPTTKIYTAVMANASIYHNSELEANISLNGAAVKVHVKPVQRSLNLIKAALDYYVLLPTGEIHVVQGIMQDAVQYENCVNTGKILGASLCLSFAYPNASYVDIAPRFPLTGPVRFGITLENADESLEAYIFEAKYKQMVKGGAAVATKPATKGKTKKSFSSVGKKKAFVPPEEIVDAVMISFAAPGDEYQRNISTVLTFNRNKTEAKWSLDIPDLDGFKLFAGALNLSDAEGNSGMHLVWNATYMEKEASVSLTLKNSSVVDFTNYTAVFNASVQQLYFATVGQFVNTPDFLIASLNETYYWDDETPLYEQLTFLSSGYSIRPEMYRQSVAYFKSLTKKRVTDSVFRVSTLGQEFMIESEAYTTRDSYTNELSCKFQNQWIDFPIANFTYQFDDETRNRVRRSNRYLDVSRGDHALYYQEEGERQTKDNSMTRNYTFGIKTIQKTMRKDFADIEDQKLLGHFSEEELYDIKPVNLNTTIHFAYLNETGDDCSHFTALNMTFSVPQSWDLNDQTRWGFGSTLRLVNESVTPEKNFGYVIQLNQTIPLLLLDFSNEIALRYTTNGLNLTYNHQSMERKYGKRVNLAMYNNLGNGDMQNGINFTSPYYNYSGSFVIGLDESQGIVVRNVIEQKGGLIPDITDMLHNYYITINMWKNATMGFAVQNRLLNVSTNHMVNLEGPVTEFQIRSVPFWIRDFFNKTRLGDLEAMVECLRDVSYKITNSSVTVGNDLVFRMPYTFNVTMENGFFLDATRVNHTLVVVVKRPGVNFNIDHVLIGPDEDTSFYTVNSEVTGNVGTIADMRSTVTGKVKFGKSVNSNLVVVGNVKVPLLVNATAKVTHSIKGLKELTKFDSIELDIEREVESIIGSANMNAFARFETFKKLFKFSKSEVGLTEKVVSRFLNVTAMNGLTISGFNELLSFARMNASSTVTVASPLVNATLNSVHEIDNVDEAFVVGSIVSSSNYQLESFLGSADSTFGWEVMDVNSPLDFMRSNGSSSLTVTSRFVNLTNSQSIDFVGVRGPFTFDQVSGKMNWNAVTILGTVTVTPMFELKNFQNISIFENAVAGANVVMTSDYIGDATMMGKMGIYEMSGFMVLDEANATVDATIGTPWLEASLNSVGKIKRMNGMFMNKGIVGKSKYSATSRLYNVTGDMSTVTRNMNGPFTFDSMTNIWTHTDETPITSGSIKMITELSGFEGLLTQALVSHDIGVNWTTPLGKLETSYNYNRENSAGIFTFETGNTRTRMAFMSKLLNMSVEGSLVGDGFQSFFVFREFTSAASAEVIVGEMATFKAAHTSTTTGSTSLTSLERFTLNQSANFTCPMATTKVEVLQNMELVNWRSFFVFDTYTATSSAKLASTLVNADSAINWAVRDKSGWFSFRSANINGNAAITSGLCNMTADGSIIANNFNGFFVFDEFTTTATAEVTLWKVMDLTAAHTSTTTDSTSITSFGKFTMTNNATVMTPIGTMEAVQESTLISLVNLLKYDQFTTYSDANIVSALLNITNAMVLDITGRDGFFTFGKVEYGMTTNVTTPFSVAENSLGFEVRDMVALTQSRKVAAGLTNKVTSDLSNLDVAAGFRLLGQRTLFAFDQIGTGANMTMTSRYVNSSMAIGSEMINSAELFRYETLKMGSSVSINATIASLKAEGGIEILDQTSLFAIRKAAMGTLASLDSCIMNVTANVDTLLVNLEKFMFFDHASHNASISLVTKYQTMEHGYQAIMLNSQGPLVSDLIKITYDGTNTGIVESTSQFTATLINNNGFCVYDSLAISQVIDLTSLIISGSTSNALTITDSAGFMKFSRGTASSDTIINTLLGSTKMVHSIDMTGVRGPMDLDMISIISTSNLTSVPANATVNFMYTISDVSGFLRFGEMVVMGNTTANSIIGDVSTASTITMSKMRGFLKLDVFKVNHNTRITGPLNTLDFDANILVRKVQNITSFKLLNSGYNVEFVSVPMNLSSVGSFRVEASNNIFDVALIEGSMVNNVSTPIVSHNSSSSVILRDMTSLYDFREVGIANELRTTTPLTDSIVTFTVAGETSWANVVQQLDTELITPAGTVQVGQFIDYENAKVSLTLPGYAYIHLHGHLNEFGDELSVKVKHALEGQELVEDMRLLLKLNESNLVYTNFSWNPEVVAELLDISVDALNRSVNYTIAIFNNTWDSLESLADLTQETVKELEATTYEIMDDPRSYIEQRVSLAKYDSLVEKIEELVEKIAELKQEIEELVKFTLEDPRQALRDFVEVVKTFLEEAKVIMIDTYDKIDEQLMIREKIDVLNRTLQEYITYISYPKETWELLKPKVEEYLEKVRETLMYDLIKDTFFEIVDVPRINDTLREYIAKVNIDNLKALLEDLKLLINTDKIQEVYDAIMEVEVVVGCVTFKDLREIDMDMIESASDKIQAFLSVENLKEFINIRKVEDMVDRINQTIQENLDMERWNDTLRTYVNVPLLKASLISIKDHFEAKLIEIIESLKQQVEIKIDELKVKYDEIKEIVRESLQLLNDELVQISGMSWNELKEWVREAITDYSEGWNELKEWVREAINDYSEGLSEETYTAVVDYLEVNVYSKIDMTKIEEAINQLNNTIFIIINATKNETHPINFLFMKYAEATIYDSLVFSYEKLVELSDEYGEIAFELIKEYSQKGKELYDNYKEQVEALYEEYSVIIKDRADEFYEKAKEQVEIYKEKAIELMDNLTEKAEELTVQLNETLVEFNKTLYVKYDEYSPVVYDFVFNVTENGIYLAGNVTEYIIEQGTPLVVYYVEMLEPYRVQIVERLTSFKNEALIFSEDTCINVTDYVQKTIEKLPEYKQQLLDLSEEYKVIAEELYIELKENLSLLVENSKDLAEDLRGKVVDFLTKTLDDVIAITKNEENFLNYYPTEWTGKTVFVLSQETISYLEKKGIELEEYAYSKYEELKAQAEEKIHELEGILADPTNKINRIPLEFLEMTIYEIYEDLKQNVTMLVEDGKSYVKVATVFINETLINLNESRIEYNITFERLQDLIIEYIEQANSSMNLFLDWVEVAKEQPYDVTVEQVINKFNETLMQALETANLTFIQTVNITNQTLCMAKELWNNLTEQENLGRIPVIVEDAFVAFIETIKKINQGIYDTVDVTKRIVEILKEDSGYEEKLEEYKELLEEYKTKIEELVEEYRPIIEEYLVEAKDGAEEFLILTKEAVVDRSISYVEFLNNTLPGWMYRYYRMDALPYEMLNYTYYTGKETILEMTNQTLDFVQQVVGRFLEYNLDHNSLTLNLTHPFYWRSFREFPTLTDAQKEVILVTLEEIRVRVLIPSQYQIERISDLVTEKYEELMDYVNVKIEENRPQVEAKLEELREKIAETRKQIETMYEEFNWVEFKENVSDRYVQARDYLQENVPIFYAKLKDPTEFASQLKENATIIIQRLKENVTDWVKDVKENEIYLAYYETAKEFGYNVTDYLVRMQEELPEVIQELLQMLSTFISEIHLPTELLREEFDWVEFKEQVFDRYVQARDYLQENIPIFYAKLKEDPTEIASQLKENAARIIQRLKEDVINWVQVVKENYPAYLETAMEFGQNVTDYLVRMQEELPEVTRELLQMLATFISEIHLPAELPPLIKPWTYKAMIFGAEHVMTFDNMVYNHPVYRADGCTYLLAKDFVDGNFTILVTEHTTTLRVKDSISVEINGDSEFFINGDGIPASPPYESARKDLLVRRDGPWVNVTTVYGINIYCHSAQFACIYELSGWYYEKTRGLLGNLDSEHHNEMILPDGTITDNKNVWINSYEVTGRHECEIPEDYVPPPANCARSQIRAIQEKCEAVFNSSESYLAPIYQIVNPVPFLNECKDFGASNCMDVKEFADNYRMLGALEGVFVQPSGCANPELDEPCTYDRPVVQPADVVFLVSESYRMLNDVTESELKENLKNLYVSIRTNYPESNFALVAYGGSDYEHCAPHLHSNEMEFFSSTNYERAIDSLEFCADLESCSCSPRKGDALKAIEYAANLNLRDNAGKIFMQIDNYEKEYEERERLAAANILGGNTITYNSISTYDQLKKTIGKVSVIGVNYDGAVLYNKRYSAETVTDDLAIPKGVYAKLATATEGAMIGYNYLEDEVHSFDVKQVLKKTFRLQLEAYKAKTVQCQSVWDIYGRPSSRCIEV